MTTRHNSRYFSQSNKHIIPILLHQKSYEYEIAEDGCTSKWIQWAEMIKHEDPDWKKSCISFEIALKLACGKNAAATEEWTTRLSFKSMIRLCWHLKMRRQVKLHFCTRDIGLGMEGYSETIWLKIMSTKDDHLTTLSSMHTVHVNWSWPWQNLF